jgi:hypothetical protein
MGLKEKLNDIAIKSAFDKIFNSFDKNKSGFLESG